MNANKACIELKKKVREGGISFAVKATIDIVQSKYKFYSQQLSRKQNPGLTIKNTLYLVMLS